MTSSTFQSLKIGLNPDQRQSVISGLKKWLASTYVLYTKTQSFHWNVQGPHFKEYHELFEEQYSTLLEHIDATAERIRTLGAMSIGRMSQYLEHSFLEEGPEEKDIPAREMLNLLLNDHETMCCYARELITLAGNNDDEGTADFITGLLQVHEKTAWMLRAHLAG